MKERYGALRTIASLHKGIAVIALLVGGIGVAAAIQGLASWIAGAFVAVAALALALMLWAAAESILVVIDIEANTRRAADALEAGRRPSA